MELSLEAKPGASPPAVILPDGWVEDVQQQLRGTKFEGLVSRLDPYANASYGGVELSLLHDGLDLYVTKSARFVAVTHEVQQALELARQQQRNVHFAGD